MSRKIKKKWFWIAPLALLGLAAGICHLPIPSDPIRISPQTTVIDGPVNPDGTINYLAALDAECSAGVTAENNAAPDLLRAFGPELIDESVRQQTLAKLGLEPLNLGAGPFFQLWDDRVNETTTQPDEARDEKLHFHEVSEALLKGQVHPKLEIWLERNEAALQSVERVAREKSRLYVPLIASGDGTLISARYYKLSFLRECAEALMSRAVIRARNGDLNGASTDILTVHRLARLMDQVPYLLSHLVGLTIDQSACQTAAGLAREGSFDKKSAKALLDELRQLRPMKDVRDTFDKCERYSMLDSMMLLWRAGSPGGASKKADRNGLDGNCMLLRANEWYDLVVKQMRRERFDPSRAQAAKELEARWNEIKKSHDNLTFPALLGKLGGWPARRIYSRAMADYIIAMTFPTLDYLVSDQDNARMAREVEITSLAAACFKGDNGRWPASLQELCPKYLDAPPRDLFTPDQTLIYRAIDSGFVVYSVGPNRRDDGGVRDMSEDKDDVAAPIWAKSSPAQLP